MQELEATLLALETCDRELSALDTSGLARMAGPLYRRGEALLKLAGISTQAFTAVDCERIREISKSGDRMMEKLRASRAATSAEWSRLNQEKYLLSSMLNTPLPPASHIDFTA